MTYEAVIFDLDDTLYLERDYAFSGFCAVAEAFSDLLGDPVKSAGAMRELFDSQHRRRVFNRMLESVGRERDEDLVRSMIDTYRNHIPTIRLLDDAESALSRLTSRYKLGLITDGPGVMQRAKLNALGLPHRLDPIIVTDELGPEAGKPNPISYEAVAEALGVTHEACVYIADNPSKDFIAPNTLGWLTVQVIRPLGVYKDAPPAALGEPAETIHSLDELDRLLL